MNKLKLIKNQTLSKSTTLKIGGKAKFFCRPRSLNEIIHCINFAKVNKLQVFFIGGGSNLLVSDNGINGLVINTCRLNKIKVNYDEIIIESGTTIEKLNKIAIKKKLTGLEFSSGLPGTIGGAVYMNARAYGGEFSKIVEEVEVLNYNGELKILRKNDFKYSYKRSVFMNDDLFIYRIKLKLKKGEPKEIRSKYKENYIDRKKKRQYKYPSAGCIFKNNYDLNLICGKLLDEMGLKGTNFGGASIPDFHANFIINSKKAKADDVKNLIEYIENKVFKEKGIKLDREIKLIGFTDHST